jgi:hypothetical protein
VAKHSLLFARADEVIEQAHHLLRRMSLSWPKADIYIAPRDVRYWG